MSKEHQKKIHKYFKTDAIAYQPGLARVCQSLNAGILLGQLLYWHGLGSRQDGFIFKTQKELFKETYLSRTQQDTAIARLKELGILQVKRAGIPAKRHFKLDFIKLQKLLPSLKKSCKLHYPNPLTLFDDNLRPITENTNKITLENTAETTLMRRAERQKDLEMDRQTLVNKMSLYSRNNSASVYDK